MKIAHIVCAYPPYYSGMGNVVFQTAEELVKLGHEVEVLTPGIYQSKEIKSAEIEPAEKHAEPLQQQIEKVNYLAPTFQYGNAAYLPQIKNELDDFDLVHLHYPFFGTANLVRQWKISNPYKPLVITYHMDTRGSGWKGLYFKYYAKYWMPKILGAADLLIASSLDFVEASDARFIYEQNKKKWLALPFGVDIERFQPRQRSETLLKRYNLNPDIPTVLFVGGMDRAHYFKGISILLKALYLLKQDDLDVQAVLVGEGELRNSYELEAQNFGLSDRVVFTGQVSDENLADYYNLGDLLVLPSVNQGEAFGMVLLEAFASGLPVLASDLPGVRSVAKDGGLTFTPGDPQALAEAIAAYFGKDNDQLAWQTKARQAAEEKYAWGPIVKQLENVYQQLV